MKETLRVKCNLIAENYQVLAKELKWHSSNNLWQPLQQPLQRLLLRLLPPVK